MVAVESTSEAGRPFVGTVLVPVWPITPIAVGRTVQRPSTSPVPSSQVF